MIAFDLPSTAQRDTVLGKLKEEGIGAYTIERQKIHPFSQNINSN